MPAAVGVRETGDDNVTADGTFTDAPLNPVQAGSTVLQTFGPNSLNAEVSMQGTVPENAYQEVNILIGEMANKMGVGPRAAWERIKLLGDTLFSQSFS